MVTAHDSDIVGKLISPRPRVAGQKDPAPKEAEALNVESRSARVIGVHIKLIHVPLQPNFILSGRAELMNPGAFQRAIPRELGSPAGNCRQRLDVRIFLGEVTSVVPK